MVGGNANGNSELLAIGAMARASGTTTRAIRFYESQGLISSSCRSGGGGRLFSSRELNRLNLITKLRRSGVSIKTISRLLAIPQESPTAARAARTVNEALRDQVFELVKLTETVRSLGSDLAQTAELLTGCYDCEEAFDDLNCGNCDCFSHVPKDELPIALRAVWPLKSP